MLRLLIIGLVIGLALSFSTEAKDLDLEDDQICDIETTIYVVNNANGTQERSSVRQVKCNDNKIQRLFQVQSGMARNCGEFLYWSKLGGRDVQRKGVSCQKLDGSWEIVNTTVTQ